MAIIDLASLKKNDFEATGIKGIQVTLLDGSRTLSSAQKTVLDERANAWTVENGELHLWKVEKDNTDRPVPVAHLASYANGTWERVVLVSEL